MTIRRDRRADRAPFGGINSRTSSRRRCFEIRSASASAFRSRSSTTTTRTAIISAAAFLNALELVGKKIENVKVVFCGAEPRRWPAPALLSYGVRRENLRMVDKSGVIYLGRPNDMNRYKAEFAVETFERTLQDALTGADAFIGLSSGGIVKGPMLEGMARDPIVFALANPDPEITPEEAKAARPDVVMATGRSDYPNQVTNVLGSRSSPRRPDVRATDHESLKQRPGPAALANLHVTPPCRRLTAHRSVRRYTCPDRSISRAPLVAPAVADARALRAEPITTCRFSAVSHAPRSSGS